MDNNTMNVMFSSNKETWETPQDLFDKLNKEFNFNLDVCALDDSAKCDRYFTPETDGLSQDWDGTCWMNPPYGKTISKWMEKAYYESLKGSTIVALIPSRTDTRYFNDYAMKANEVRFIKGRLKFGGSKNSAPFPSTLVVFDDNIRDTPKMTMYDRAIDYDNNYPLKPFNYPITPFVEI